MLLRLTRLHTLTVALLLITAVPFPVFFNPHPAAAQTNPDRKAEADRLLQQGNQHLQNNEYRDAKQSLEKSVKYGSSGSVVEIV